MKNPQDILSEITIRTELRPGDIGKVIQLHCELYRKEYGYGIEFETYVASGLEEFYRNYDPVRSRVWVLEHENNMAGFLLLMDRGDSAQLRYFLLKPEYRGIGLGKKLMELFMEFLEECGYKSAYLWTTNEQIEASALYKKFGFKLIEEKDSTAFGKPLKEQTYYLIISEPRTGQRKHYRKNNKNYSTRHSKS